MTTGGGSLQAGSDTVESAPVLSADQLRRTARRLVPDWTAVTRIFEVRGRSRCKAAASAAARFFEKAAWATSGPTAPIHVCYTVMDLYESKQLVHETRLYFARSGEGGRYTNVNLLLAAVNGSMEVIAQAIPEGAGPGEVYVWRRPDPTFASCARTNS